MSEVFIASQAVAAGTLTEYQLRRWYRSIFPDVYLPKRRMPSLDDRIRGAWLWSRRRAVVAGMAASALHGASWVDPDATIELVARSARPHPGLLVRNETLACDDITEIDGLPVTAVARTAFDLGRYLPRVHALIRLDALMRSSPFSCEDVELVAKRYRGARNLRRLRRVLPLVDGGAASPRETRLRLLLVDAGLPVPSTQIPVYDGCQLAALLDMGWEDFLVAVEYDGDQHRTDRRQFVKDIDRIARLQDLGWVIVRVVREHRAADVVNRVRQALFQRGWRPNRH